jgi:hypothetical protein
MESNPTQSSGKPSESGSAKNIMGKYLNKDKNQATNDNASETVATPSESASDLQIRMIADRVKKMLEQNKALD